MTKFLKFPILKNCNINAKITLNKGPAIIITISFVYGKLKDSFLTISTLKTLIFISIIFLLNNNNKNICPSSWTKDKNKADKNSIPLTITKNEHKAKK